MTITGCFSGCYKASEMINIALLVSLGNYIEFHYSFDIRLYSRGDAMHAGIHMLGGLAIDV